MAFLALNLKPLNPSKKPSKTPALNLLAAQNQGLGFAGSPSVVTTHLGSWHS